MDHKCPGCIMHEEIQNVQGYRSGKDSKCVMPFTLGVFSLGKNGKKCILN